MVLSSVFFIVLNFELDDHETRTNECDNIENENKWSWGSYCPCTHSDVK